MQQLSRKDLETLKRLVNLSIVDEKARTALSQGRLPGGSWKLSPEALDTLHSITPEELSAFASVYEKVRAAGASKAALQDSIIL